VRPETVAQVEQAIAELDRQRHQVHLAGQSLMLDLVMQAPDRFASACRRALETELPSLRPATIRVRSHLREKSHPAAAAETLDAVTDHGSDGVILKAPDDPWWWRPWIAWSRPACRS
jgi:LacI family transcriptional regulator